MIGKNNETEFKVTGTMTEAQTYTIMLTKEIGYIIKSTIWRVGFLMIAYKASPEVTTTILSLLMKNP